MESQSTTVPCYCCSTLTPNARAISDGRNEIVCASCANKVYKIVTDGELDAINSVPLQYAFYKKGLNAVREQMQITQCACCDKQVKDDRKASQKETCVMLCADCDTKLSISTNMVPAQTDWPWASNFWKEGIVTLRNTIMQDKQAELNGQCECCNKECKDQRPSRFSNDKYGNLCWSCSEAIHKQNNWIPLIKDDIYISKTGWNQYIDTYRATLNNQNKRNKNMPYDNDGNEVTIGDMVKKDAADAAYRVAAKQITKGVKTGIRAALKDKGTEESKIQAVAEFFNTDIGEALIAAGLGYGVLAIPGLKDDARVKRISEEFRIDGMATAGNALADNVLKHLMPVMTDAMKNLPEIPAGLGLKKAPKKRVKIDVETSSETPPVVETVEASPVLPVETKKAAKASNTHAE